MIIQQDLILLLRILKGIPYFLRIGRADIAYSDKYAILKAEAVAVDGKPILTQHRTQAGDVLPANLALRGPQPVVQSSGR